MLSVLKRSLENKNVANVEQFSFQIEKGLSNLRYISLVNNFMLALNLLLKWQMDPQLNQFVCYTRLVILTTGVVICEWLVGKLIL